MIVDKQEKLYSFSWDKIVFNDSEYEWFLFTLRPFLCVNMEKLKNVRNRRWVCSTKLFLTKLCLYKNIGNFTNKFTNSPKFNDTQINIIIVPCVRIILQQITIFESLLCNTSLKRKLYTYDTRTISTFIVRYSE